ncbi:MAG: alpha/beta fold hydrolase [Bryobacteraceae bacterium]
MPERDLIARVERANAAEFAEILRRLTDKEAAALRNYWGPEAFEEMRAAVGRRARAGAQGNVVVLHGIMGGELAEVQADSSQRSIWLNFLRLIAGAFKDLGLNAAGTSVRDIRATGILKKYYGLQLLTLSQNWNTRAFWYDWRLDINSTADELAKRVSDWFPGKPVHLVAHSMGGLVARAFIARHSDQWKAMNPGRLVMLGTPNLGSFAIPQLLMGMNDVLRIVALADLTSSKRDLVETIKTFVGSYQMMPAESAISGLAPLYDAKTYAGINPPEDRFAAARAFQSSIAKVVDPQRMIYVAGFNKATYCGVRSFDKLDSPEGYEVTQRGDGTVPHVLGLLDGIPTFYVEEEHGALPNNRTVLDNMNSLLTTGKADGLLNKLPASVRGKENQAAILAKIRSERDSREQEFGARAAAFRATANARGIADGRVSPHEGSLEDTVVAGFLRGPSATAAKGEAIAPHKPVLTKLKVRVMCGGIETVGEVKGTETVDAVAVGHYLGVMPVSAEGQLDKAISGDGERLIERFSKRGVIRGELAQLFFLQDPRKTKRTIVIAGMGSYGRFGAPECTALASEIYASLALLGKKHLATVLIGSGTGNLEIGPALDAWVEGLRQAQAALALQGHRNLPDVMFVEYDPRRAILLDNALHALAKETSAGFQLEVTARFKGSELASLKRRWLENEKGRIDREAKGGRGNEIEGTPTRLTVERAGPALRFSAITESASVPLRENSVDPELVDEANDQLVTDRDAAEAGRYLLRLVIPEALEPHLSTVHPLVITCDSTCARIHWEMMAQPGLATGSAASFLGIGRSLTRQFVTGFASLNNADVPADRSLRVMIIGDPAADMALPGAALEAERVRELFRRHKPEADVLSLIGPADATRTRVMHELLVRDYDIVHYSGHCVFDPNDVEASGWIFTGGKRLSARELGRVNRMPSFVFSNACESGITPERASLRNAALGPSFAEAFFARGVRNFICTGWPVSDAAAVTFAEVFYEQLLGKKNEIHIAVRQARLETKKSGDGALTWGAYQHYGDPFWRLR